MDNKQMRKEFKSWIERNTINADCGMGFIVTKIGYKWVHITNIRKNKPITRKYSFENAIKLTGYCHK